MHGPMNIKNLKLVYSTSVGLHHDTTGGWMKQEENRIS
jgi:hypothetical protein